MAGTTTHLRLGSKAPDFTADSNIGKVEFHKYIEGSWAILFSHPQDFTPVCTTELGAFAKLEPEFTKRGVKLLGLSADTTDSHATWIKDISEVTGGDVKFPIIADPDRVVANQYDMIDYQDPSNIDRNALPLTIRSVFFIDPKKTIRTILSYPASTGRNAAEVLRIVDSLQAGDKHKIATPIDWQPGQDVIVANSVKDAEAKELFPNLRIIKPYLRYTALPQV
ncbi:mitochondrial peroxiredoxin PRX1 [Metarhizium album ARSEF 1941]|uniref:Mitochondrial peroxiredoxin PRX1 n=1 Tax=Metarhizium album (strain ARSEF 1941) TaxID=1081103 RepID=A0A0B2WP85_METAS|nr:mitochondrial peroxiredoxin PRX1 [Metarhizium album ARSEF 1941]KHN95479.1 mitochondrial peroxiredoxin PRX1 [Metarhizium album ARSEF 1941]